LAGIRIPQDRAPSIAVRLMALREGAALVARLPLRELEPAAVFHIARLPANQSD
jgi:hypothetical protein